MEDSHASRIWIEITQHHVLSETDLPRIHVSIDFENSDVMWNEHTHGFEHHPIIAHPEKYCRLIHPEVLQQTGVTVLDVVKKIRFVSQDLEQQVRLNSYRLYEVWDYKQEWDGTEGT